MQVMVKTADESVCDAENRESGVGRDRPRHRFGGGI
jgi:hypothetical protein